MLAASTLFSLGSGRKRPLPKKYPADTPKNTVRLEKKAQQEPLATGTKYRLVFKKPNRCELRLKNDEGELLAGVRYRVEFGALHFEGKTDAEGMLSHKVGKLTEGRLIVWYEDDADLDTPSLRPRSYRIKLT